MVSAMQLLNTVAENGLLLPISSVIINHMPGGGSRLTSNRLLDDDDDDDGGNGRRRLAMYRNLGVHVSTRP